MEDRYEICYAPGLKDKNEKLLYAGDIVRFYNEITVNDTGPDIGEIIHTAEDYSFWFWLSNGHSEHSIEDNDSWHMEHIGNKYENPKLLNGRL